MSFKNIVSVIAFQLVILTATTCHAQAILNADGPGRTYELINSVLAPTTNPAEEAPDMANGTHASFGRHIAEVWDSTLNKYVFEFYIHALIDNDVSTLDNDRQRVEIKTYAPSPDSMKGYEGDLMTFKWMFRLPVGFQPSPNFTHIHQIKGVNGDESDPIFTITPCVTGGNKKLQIRYVADSSTNFKVLTSGNLSDFLGKWLQVTEIIRFDTSNKGTYSINITKVGDTVSMLKCTATGIKTIRVSNSFARPKWGIYRSILTRSYLRDDSLRLSDISIQKNKSPLSVYIISVGATLNNNLINIHWSVQNEWNVKQYIVQYGTVNNANSYKDKITVTANGGSDYNAVFNSPCICNQYYRIKVINEDGSFFYSDVVYVQMNKTNVSIFPNPASNAINVFTDKVYPDTYCVIIDDRGRIVNKLNLTNNTTNIFTGKLSNGMYILQLVSNSQIIENSPFIIAK